jgi:hypothetical protein
VMRQSHRYHKPLIFHHSHVFVSVMLPTWRTFCYREPTAATCCSQVGPPSWKTRKINSSNYCLMSADILQHKTVHKHIRLCYYAVCLSLIIQFNCNKNIMEC